MLRTLRNHTKVIMVIVILFFVLSCFAGYGLYIRGGGNSGGGMKDYPVAEINGRKIMRSELEQGAARLSDQISRNITSEDIPHIRRAFIDNLAVQSEIEKEIKVRNIEVAKAEIDSAYTEIMDNYPTREEFMAYMQRSGITEKQIKDDIERQLKVRKLVDEVCGDIKIEEKDIRAFYDSTKNFLYKQPAGIKVNIATFKNKASAEAVRKAVEAGAKWDDEIAKYSSDIEMATSYDHPALFDESMISADKQLAPLKDYAMGKVTPVLDAGSNFSYIAIKRGVEKERVLSFEESSGDIELKLKNQKAMEEERKFFDDLLTRAKIDILDASIFPKAEPASGDVAEPVSEDAAAPSSGDKN